MARRKPRPKDLLSRSDYSNYRSIRAVAMLFILLGGVYLIGSLGMGAAALAGASEFGRDRDEKTATLVIAIVMGLLGFCGFVGGIATLRGDRRTAPLVKVLACVYLLGFPIGTLLGYVMLKGHSRYLDSLDEIRGMPDPAVFD